MKKVLAVAALLIFTASVGYAAWALPSTAGTFTCGAAAGQQLIIKPSANVGFQYDGAPTAGDGTSYSIGAYHGQGTRVYGSSSTDTNIFYKPMAATPGITAVFTEFDIPAAPENSNGVYASGWTASK